ncbi:MAG: acyl-CoA dehydrogenase family protein [Myxococcota bacterium]|nr:acyl-CoA dehydrogenase family protein [Myxococcota bacterium]
MIDFELDEELELLRRTAGEFATDHLRPHVREHEAGRELSPAAHEGFAAIGLGRLEFPASLGGSELGALARSLVMEELAAADPGGALALDRLGAAFYPLAELGGSDALESFAAPLLDTPHAHAALCWTGAGTRARLEQDGETLSGTLPWVPAGRVDLLVLLDERGCRVVRDGIHCEAVRGAGLRAAGASELVLEAAPIVARHDDADAARLALARARVYTASLLVGVLREAAEFSRAYALERRAFGKPIAHHQGLAFLIADMATTVDAARLLTWEAAWRLDEGLASGVATSTDAAEAAASAFVEAAEAANFVGPNAVQILGGHGFMQDFPVEKMMREARALSLLLGGADLAREEAGQAIVDNEGQVGLSLEVAR